MNSNTFTRKLVSRDMCRHAGLAPEFRALAGQYSTLGRTSDKRSAIHLKPRGPALETEPTDCFVGCYIPQIVAVADTWLSSTDSMRRSPNRP